ncbi:hypothetical protein Tco_0150628 [Tanacetum coccineum]
MVTLMLHNPHYREKSFDVGFITILSYLYSGALFLGVIEEFVNDALDSTLDSDDIEDEIDEEIDMVLTLITGDTAVKLPKFVRKERLKQPTQTKITYQGSEKRVVSHDLQLWRSNAPPNGNQLTSLVVGWYCTGPKLRENDLNVHGLFTEVRFANNMTLNPLSLTLKHKTVAPEDCSIIINKALVFAFVALADSTSAAVSAQSTISTNLETR